MTLAGGPTHDLAVIQELVRKGHWIATDKAANDVAALGLDPNDVQDCISDLSAGDFYKTMASEKKKGAMQDVYRPKYLKTPIYLKLELSDKVVVISFKRDTSR